MPGFTAYMGLLDIGQPGGRNAGGRRGDRAGWRHGWTDRQNEGLPHRRHHGGAEKCRYAVETLGFDLCLDHRADDFAEQLAQACPQGTDVYYENVGGKVFDAVLPPVEYCSAYPSAGW